MPTSPPTVSQPRPSSIHALLWSRKVSNTWSSPTTRAEVIARANGRRAYNSRRQRMAVLRRAEMLRLFNQYGTGYGVRARIARELGVARSTITRDFREAVWLHQQPCPTCGTVLDNKAWQAISLVGGNYGPDPIAFMGQAEIMARRVLIELLPVVLADLGFFEDDDGKLVNGNDDDRAVGFTVSDLARRVIGAVDARPAAAA